MLILGIESSCDETAAAVVAAEQGRLKMLSNVVASQIDIHAKFGGVVPEIASRAHAEAISGVVSRALADAALAPTELDAVAVTSHPGLIGALLVGVSFAKGFAYANSLPLVPIDHIRGHVAAVYLTEDPPEPPFVAMVASGGHCSIFLVHSYTDFELIGSTRDDAAGEAFDKIGRILGLAYPAGAEFDRLASVGFRRAAGMPDDADIAEAYRAFTKTETYRDPAFRLPSPALAGDTLDFSFSGLKTAAVNLAHHAEQTGRTLDRELFAARFTYEAIEGIIKKTDAALARLPGRPLAICGGVAANSHLRRRAEELCRRRGVRLCLPPVSLCGDNAAMIAAQGVHEFASGVRAGLDLNPSAAD